MMNIFDNPNSETATNSSLIDASDRTLDPYGFVPTLLNKREPGAALNSIELAGKNHVNTDGIDRSDRGLFTSRLYTSQFDVSEADQSAGIDLITGGDTGENQPVQAAIQTAENLLNKFAVAPDFITKMQTAFGNSFDARKTGFFADSWRNGELGRLPGIEVRSQSDLAGANGAFAAATNTIYLAQEFVDKNSGDVKAVASVILEEYGHFIDSQINTTDAAGDEGEIFSNLIQGKQLTLPEISQLQTEDDSVVLVLDGRVVAIEQAASEIDRQTLDFSADDITFETFGKFKYEDLKGNLNPSGQFNNFGLKFDWNLNASVGLIPFVDLGKPGMANFRYPVNVDVELPNDISNNQDFSIKLLPNFTVGGASINGSGLELPSAGVDLSFNVGASGIKNISFQNSDGSVDQLGNLDFSGFPQPIERNLITKKLEGASISPIPLGDFGEVQFEIPKPNNFKPSGDLQTGIVSELPELSTNKSNSEKLANLQLDLDRIAAVFFPELKVLGGKLSFPNSKKEEAAAQKAKEDLQIQLDVLKTLQTPEALQEAERLRQQAEKAREEAEQAKKNSDSSRNRIDFNYDLLDIKANLGLALRQDFIFDPDQVRVTMSVDGQGEQTGILGDPNTEFKFKAPSDRCGVIEVKARYELFGNLKNEIGLAPRGSLEGKALEGKLSLQIGGRSISTPPIGPLFGPVEIPQGGAVGKSLIKIAGSDAPIKINPIDIAATGKEDVTRNLVIEKTYKIPYNLPISVSNASVVEGDSGTKDMVFTVTRRKESNEPTTLSYTSSQGSGTVTIPVGSAGQTAEIKVPITGDTTPEPDETFTLTVKDPSGKTFADCKDVDSVEATGTIIDDDSKPEPPKDKGQTYNDPRIITLDKQYHDFQAVGEFTLVESTSGDLKIQVRQQAVGNNPLSNVSDNSAVATVLGGKRIGIYKDRGLLIDGNPTNIANNDSIIIGDGRIYREGNIYTVVYATGDQLIAKVQPSRININVALTKERQGKIVGLLGNFNGDPKDDLAKRDGTVISQPVPIRQLYGEYADSWRISQGGSLFDYKPGEDTNTFTNKDFPRKKVTLKDLNPADIQKAEERIGNLITDPTIREAAIIDYILTGFDETIIEDAIASQTPDSILAIAIPPRAFEDFSSTFVNTPVKIDVVENDEGTLGVGLAIANFDATTTKGGNIKLDDNATPDNKSDDQLIYTPPANFTGIDTFNYTLTDGKETSTSKVTISVPAFNLSTLNGSNGFVLNGSNAGNFTGVSTSSIGDFNSDGFDDLIIGAFGADPNGNNAAGESYVLFGSKAGFPVNFNPANLNGSNGFIINGVDTNGFSGGAVSSAGDVNGDGIDDLAIGVFGATANGKNNAGKTYIVFGSKNPFPVRFNLSELNGNNGFVFNGNNEFDYVGLSISKLGDLNGDSLDDLLVNAPGPLNSSAGKSYIIYGRKGSFSPSLNTTDINGTNGFVINDTDGNSGSSVKGVGDINGDGMADLIIGTDAANPDNNTPGKIQVLFGSRTGFPAVVNRSELNGKNGFIIEGVEINTSTFVSGAGDINGDGINDLIIGVADATANNNSAAGKTYIVFGKKAEFAPLVNLNQLNGSNGFVINGTQIEERSGISVDGAGDINGDGFDDIIIGASGASANGNNAAGKSYILFGSNQAFPASFNLAELNGNNGFIFNGATADDLTGTAVSSAGDINGDGLGDIIIGTPGSLFNNAPGKSYVVFGNTAFGGVYKPSSDPADLELVQTISNKTPYIGDEVTLKYTLTNKGKGVARRIKITDLLPPGVSFLSAATDQGIYDSNTGMWEVGNIRENLSRTLDIVVKVEKTGSLVTTGQVTAVRETDPDSIPNNNNPAEDDQDSEEFGVAGGGGLTLVFDERYYLAQHADVKAAVEKRKFKNGFSHFVRHGEKENRDFRVLVFDESYYLAQNPDVKAAVEKRKFRSGLRHFIEWGQFEEQRKPNSFDPTAKRLQFDEDYYLQQNSDVEKAVEKRKFRTGFAHFIEWGQIEGRKPSLTGVNLLPG